jgi:hypothetical protein
MLGRDLCTCGLCTSNRDHARVHEDDPSTHELYRPASETVAGRRSYLHYNTALQMWSSWAWAQTNKNLSDQLLATELDCNNR